MSLKNSLNKTNLDVENSNPQGGPIGYGDLDNNFVHKYSPSNTYLDIVTRGGDGSGNISPNRSPISEFGIEDTNLQPGNIFEISSLDTTSDLAGVKQGTNGGPNRFNNNRFSTVGAGDGIYTNFKASTSPTSPSPSKGVPIKTKNGKDSKSLLSAYSSENTYIESINKFKTENNDKV
tara:strand:- start:13032 stop:13562 length:531 start_codon:yes stop_codon:yes gene_type:complete